MRTEALSAGQKALQLNLDRTWYGTIAEVGAGQEVARWFFAVGGAAGTVAKTISAYDMTVSDGIYGKSHRYVTPSCRAWPTSSRGIGSRWTSWMCRGHSSSARTSAVSPSISCWKNSDGR